MNHSQRFLIRLATQIFGFVVVIGVALIAANYPFVTMWVAGFLAVCCWLMYLWLDTE